MNTKPKIDISILQPAVREISPELDDDLCEEPDFSCDPGPASIDFANKVVMEEKLILARLDSADTANVQNIIDQIVDELIDECSDTIRVYDFGYAGILFTLSSINCIPVESNIAYYDEHVYPIAHPWIKFLTPVEVVGLLIDASTNSHVTILNDSDGTLSISTSEVRNFNKMAEYLVHNYLPNKSNR